MMAGDGQGTWMRRIVLAAMAALGLAGSAVAAQPPPKVVGAADGIFAAFATHPVVALGE